MQLIKRFFDFYINSSIHVALAVCCLAYISMLEFNLKHNFELLWFLFFATVSGYNFVKFFGLAKFHHRSLANWLKYIQVFSLFCFIGLVVFTFKLKIDTIYVLLGLGLITFFYAIPFIPRKYLFDTSKNLRAISGLKIYVIALVWSITTVIIPVIEDGHPIGNDVWITMFQRGLYVIVVMLPFEIRDMTYDSLKLATIPQRIGILNTKIMGVVLILLFLLLEYFKDSFGYVQLFVLVIVATVVILFLLGSYKTQRKHYSAFWVEAIPVFWLFLKLL